MPPSSTALIAQTSPERARAESSGTKFDSKHFWAPVGYLCARAFDELHSAHFGHLLCSGANRNKYPETQPSLDGLMRDMALSH
jgi:hypothetical protein